MTGPKISLQLGSYWIGRKFAVVLRHLLDHEENRKCKCWKKTSKQTGQACREGIELGTAEHCKLVAAGEASIQKSKRVALRKRPHMRRANLMLGRLSTKS